MKIEFYREKNAKSIKDVKVDLRKPDEKELKEELIKKLEQKAGRIEIASDTKSVRKYLEEKIKREGSRFTKFNHVPSDSEAKNLMTRNICIDIAQVIKDISDCFGLKIEIKTKEISDLTELEISKKIFDLCKEFRKKKNKQTIFNQICSLYCEYANLFNYNLEEIEEERIVKEKKQGNFLRGLYVIFE